jgi:alpha-ketoglutarate-dependent taurine dioxygenase
LTGPAAGHGYRIWAIAQIVLGPCLTPAREVADDGGDTEFANTYAAYTALPDARKAELGRYRVVHSVAASQLLLNPDPTAEQRAKWDRAPSREHPLVWTRSDGRKSLLIGATAGEIVDLVVRDNTGMLHRAIPYEPTSRRLMHRTTLVGDEAIA